MFSFELDNTLNSTKLGTHLEAVRLITDEQVAGAGGCESLGVQPERLVAHNHDLWCRGSNWESDLEEVRSTRSPGKRQLAAAHAMEGKGHAALLTW